MEKKKANIIKAGIALFIIIAIVIGIIVMINNGKSSKTAQEGIQTAMVTRRTIVNTVTGSGTVEAYETYNIVPTVTGEIVFCDVEEGAWVEEDKILYKFDTERSDNAISKAANSVENASLSLQTAEDNVRDLTITASAKGVVNDLSLLIGDKASGAICTILDNTYMIASINVSASDAENIAKGDRVTLGLEAYMVTMEAYVDRISSATVAGESGSILTSVDVILENPGSVAEGTYCSATFHTAFGDFEGAEAGVLKYPDKVKATAEQSGTVAKINVKNGDWVNEGDVIAVLENNQITNQLKTARMNYADAVSNLSDTKKTAEDYVLTAPIAGKVLQKNYKKGDTVAGNNSTTLMVIADTTKMKFTINVDELDVAKITVGQEVTIEADAIEGEIFLGKIETVSHLGTASNGVTYYPVDVVIEEPGELIPGMNVSAEIIVESAENAVAVPSGAVTYYDGEYYVNVVGEVEGMEDMPEMGGAPMERPTGDFEDMSEERPTGDVPFGDMPNRGDMPQGMKDAEGAMPMGNMKGKERDNASGRNNGKGAGEEVKSKMYSEPVRVKVTTGVSDDDYTEIVTGNVSVGMIVEVSGSTSSSSRFGIMGGMPMGGGMSMGNMGNRSSGGGMPGGMR